jgi:hypothetical protein
MIGESTLASIAGLGLEPVDEIDHIVEPAAGFATDAASGDGNRKVGLAGAGPTDQDGVALLGDECAASKFVDEVSLIDVSLNWKSSRSLASGSLAMVSWYLIERACFSLISALSRSPTMRWGPCWRLTAVAMISSKAAFMP